MTPICALIQKDLRIHWRAALVLVLGWPAFLRFLVLIQPDSTWTEGRTPTGVAGFLTLTTVSPLGITIANWLVERERSKETFAWLRTLPVSDGHIVASKFVFCLLVYLVGAAIWWVALWDIRPSLTAMQWISTWLVTFVLGSMALLCQIALTGRLAAMMPAGLALLGVLAFYPVQRSPDLLVRAATWWNDSRAHILLWLVVAGLEALVIGLAYLRFRSLDTRRLVE
jgi:hypothetical protein